MTDLLLITANVLLAAAACMLAVLLKRSGGAKLDLVLSRLDTLEKLQDRGERALRDEVALNRQETATQARSLRDEVQASLKHSTDSLVQSVDRISAAQHQRLETFAAQLQAVRQASESAAGQLRAELTALLNGFKDSQEKRLAENAGLLRESFESFGARLSDFSRASQENAQQGRAELAASFKDFRDSLQAQMTQITALQNQQFEGFAALLKGLTEESRKKSDELRLAVEGKLAQLQTDNAAKLEEMRRTVDEKLQGTLDKRLGESFKLVSERLELVHKGLGEMQTLASGVGDLKKVLTNVKTRGTWGETQLGSLLEQILTPEQYGCNVATKPPGRETVEFALRLPGREEHDGHVVWLPIDAKFPVEDYERLVDASERGDAAGVEEASRALESRIKSQARDVKTKYIGPPHTTDFGLLYLPTEGLYSEVLRRPGLVDAIRREQGIIIVGPTTLAALLNSLQMGFRTLAIQKRSSEVWKVLGAVKTDFGKFGELLEKVKKKLDQTSNTIDQAAQRSRQLERKLKQVEALPQAEAAVLLGPAAPLESEIDLVPEDPPMPPVRRQLPGAEPMEMF